MENVKVILWGLGAMGGGIGRMLAKKKGVDIVGAIDIGEKLGKAISDAIATVAGYSILLKNAVSSLGLIIVIAIVLVPIIKIFIMATLYRLTAAIIEPISDNRIVSAISSVGDSLILIMSCVIVVSILFFVMISIIASAGKLIIGV